MNTTFSRSALSNEELDRGILACAAHKHTTDAELLAFIAEYASRRRYLALGYESMVAFCVRSLHLTEDSAYKRMQVARVALEVPALFPALADGRLHFTTAYLLATRLTAENADELIAAATHKTMSEVREMLAQRYPQRQPSRVSLLSDSNDERAGSAQSAAVAEDRAELAPAQVEQQQTKLASMQVEEVDCWARITPLSGDRYSVTLTIDRATMDLLRQNQSLLSHCIPSGNLAQVLRRVLAESAQRLERRRFRSSRTAQRTKRHASKSDRYVPKHVRDAVWQRDGGQCTFVGETGHRCGSRTRLELDHIVPVARGGQSTVDNLRLRCRAHNQYEAERAFGADFMRHKREQARQSAEPPSVPNNVAAATPERAPARRDWIAEARARASAAGVFPRREPDVASVLRQLGMRADRARELASVSDTIPEAPFEERLRVALSFHGATVATPVRAAVDAPAGRATQ